MSMMKKLFNFGNQGSSRKSPLMQLQRRPHFEPLEDRQLLAVSSLLGSAYAGSVSTVGNQTEMALKIETETGNAAFVGIQVNTENATFDPSAINVYDAAGKLVSASKVHYKNADYLGGKSSIVVLELAPGDYKVTVGGDKGTIGNFTCDVFLPGNYDGSGTVTQLSTHAGEAAYALLNGQLNFPTLQYYQSLGININSLDVSVFDINGNGIIAKEELQVVGHNQKAGHVDAELRAWNQAPTLPGNIDAGTVSEKATTAITKTITGVTDPEGDKFEFLSDLTIKSFTYNGQTIAYPSGMEYSITDKGDGTALFSFNPKGLISVIPAGQTAELVFNYKVQDTGSGTYSVGTITVKITGVNDAPTAGDINISTNEKTEKEIDFAGKFSDPDYGETGTLVIYITGKNGEEALTAGKSIALANDAIVRMDSSGKVYYNPNGAFDHLPEGTANGADQFFYRVKDAQNEYSGQAIVSVTINGVNDPPTTLGDYATTTTEKDSKTITLAELLTKVSDPDQGDTLTIVSVNSTSDKGAAVTFNSTDKTVTYNPGSLFYYLKADDPAAGDFFFVTITDGKETVELKVVVSITGVNDPITVTDQIKQVTSSSASEWISFGKVDYSCLDSNVPLTYEILSVNGGPTGYTLTNNDFQIQADGTLLVKKSSIPDKTESGEEYVLKVKVTDSRTGVAKSVEVDLTINVIEYQAPVIAPTTPINVGEKDTAAKTVTITATDGGPEGNAVAFVPGSLKIKSQDPALSTIDITYSLTAAGLFTFKINNAYSGVAAGQSGTLIFEYVVRESVYGVETVGTITVNVSGVNDAPVINGTQLIEVTKGAASNDFNPLANVTDPDYGDVVKVYSIVTKTGEVTVNPGQTVELPSGALVTLNADGTIKYNPNGKFNDVLPGNHETDVIKFKVTDGTVVSSEWTINIQINGENVVHTVPDQTMTAASNGDAVSVRVGKIQVNDIDGPEGGQYRYALSMAGTNPGFTVDADGYIYVPRSAIQTGETYTLTVIVSDDNPNHDVSATITVNVVEKEAPKCTDFTFEDRVGEKSEMGLTVDLNTYVTKADPKDTLTFQSGVTMNSAVIGTATDVSSRISAADIAKMCTVTADGSFTFVPNPNNADLLKFLSEGYTLTLTFSYTVVDDATGLTATGKVTVKVTGVNDAPTAGHDDYSATEIQAIGKSNPLDVLANDSDPDMNDKISIVKVDGNDIAEGQTVRVLVTIGGQDKGYAEVEMVDGKLIFVPNGAFSYLAAGESANFTFSYTISDGKASSSANITVKVVGQNAPPTVPTAPLTASVERNATGENKSVVIDLLNGANDPNGDPMKIAKINGEDVTGRYGQTITFPEGDYIVINSAGTSVTYHPGTRFATLGQGSSETRSFTYQLTDGKSENNLSNTGTVNVTINGINDPPVIQNTIPNQSGREETISIPLETAGQEYFIDPNGDPLTYSVSKGSDPDGMISNVWVDNTTKTLYITFSDQYDTEDKRIPVAITLTATDGFSNPVSMTFTAVAIPQTTANVETKVVKASDASDWNATTAPTSVDKMVVGESYYIEIWVTDLANTIGSDGYVKPPAGYEGLNYSNGLGGVRFDFSIDLGLVDVVDFYNADLDQNYAIEYAPRIFAGLPYDVGAPVYDAQSGLSTYKWVGGSIRITGTIPQLGINGDSWLIGRILVTPTEEGTLNADIVVQELARFSDIPGGSQAMPQGQINKIAWTPIQIVSSGNPLYGMSSQEVVADGGVYVRNVTTPTSVSANGTVATLPENANWIHEWQDHWAEIWVHASQLHYFQNAMTDLTYNSDYFTAVEVIPGSVFKSSFHPSINDAEGLITNIGGAASGEVPAEGYILLGRVKFESIGNDNVAWEESLVPHDLGIALVNSAVTTIEGNVISIRGNRPTTELWAVPYDINDDGQISLSDYMGFAAAFQNQSKESDLIVSMFDYDRNGSVSINDWSVFIQPLLGKVTRDDYANLYFHQNFTQRYIGQTISADSMETVSTIIDAANKAWQNALGLDKPLDIQIIVKDLGEGTLLGEAQIVALDANGLPSKGIITIDNDGGGLGWYSQLDEPVTQGRYDLYTVILHEMGHVYGFTSNYDAFSAIVGQFGSQIDTAGLHTTEASDLMSATLEAGIRKFISTLDADAILAAYNAAKENPELRDFIAAPTSLTQAQSETTPTSVSSLNSFGVMPLSESSWVTQPAVVLDTQRNESIDAMTANKLHAMGLSVSLEVNRNNDVSRGNDLVFESDLLIEENFEDVSFQNNSGKQNAKDLLLLELELEWNAEV